MDDKKKQEQQTGAHAPLALEDAPRALEEHKPIITKYFMAEWVEEDRREGTPAIWCVYRLSDFLNPSLPQGPDSIYSNASEDSTRALLGRLDGLYDETIAHEDRIAVIKDFITAGWMDNSTRSTVSIDALIAYTFGDIVSRDVQPE